MDQTIQDVFEWLYEVDHVRLTYGLTYNGIELERIRLFKHQGPVEATLASIKDSGLLDGLNQAKTANPDAIIEILIRPTLPLSGRWEITGKPYDRLFVVMRPNQYNQVTTNLKQQGFTVDEDHPSSGFEPYYFTQRNNRFARGVHNSDAFIIQTDFPRPEKVFEENTA